MFQNCTNCISASKKCNSCWVRLSGSIVWCTIFCCTPGLHLIAHGVQLQSWAPDLQLIAKGVKLPACKQQTCTQLHQITAIGAPLLQQNITDTAKTLLYNPCIMQKDAPLKYSLEQNVGQGAVKRCIEIAQKCFSIAKMHKQWEILQIYCSCPHQLAWHFRRSCRSLQDCATKCANHLSTCNVGQHIMLIHVLLLSSYTESTLVRLSYPLAAGSNLFKHVSWENLTKSNPTDNKATIQWFFIWNELGSS